MPPQLLQSRYSDVKLGQSASIAGYSLVHRETVASTNALALELGAKGRSKVWVVADAQVGGRGRHGRTWVSPAGNLYASLLLLDPCKVADAPKLGFVAGLAVADLIREYAANPQPFLKWPNDLVAGASKLSGVLLEGRSVNLVSQAVAIGIGINVATVPEGTGRAVTSLEELRVSVGCDTLFAELSDRMAYWLMIFAGGAGFETICAEWLRLALPTGTRMSVKLPRSELSGSFRGVDGDGRLVLDTLDGLVHVEAGDVFLNDERPIARDKDKENAS